MVVVEQNITFGFRLVERAAILRRGSVAYEGDVAGLDTERVAELLGVGRLLSRGSSAPSNGRPDDGSVR